MRWDVAEGNALRTEKEGSFCVSSFESPENILPKIQDQCVAVVMPWRIVVHILVWAVILKKEGKENGVSHMNRGGVEQVANVQKSTQQC